jgi:hypothetical protein
VSAPSASRRSSSGAEQAADGDGGLLDEVDDERGQGAHGDLGQQVTVAESDERKNRAAASPSGPIWSSG